MVRGLSRRRSVAVTTPLGCGWGISVFFYPWGETYGRPCFLWKRVFFVSVRNWIIVVEGRWVACFALVNMPAMEDSRDGFIHGSSVVDIGPKSRGTERGQVGGQGPGLAARIVTKQRGCGR